MTKLFKNAALAAALAVAPFAANAATVTPAGATQDIASSDIFSFQLDAVDGTAGATETFTFTNSSAGSTQIAVTLATVAQFLGHFTDGVQFAWTNGGGTADFAQGEDGSATFNAAIEAGGSNTLTLTYGAFSGGAGDVDFFVSSVPLPAGGLLLLSAFGAVAVARRKKA